jgi:hypothetical protein
MLSNSINSQPQPQKRTTSATNLNAAVIKPSNPTVADVISTPVLTPSVLPMPPRSDKRRSISNGTPGGQMNRTTSGSNSNINSGIDNVVASVGMNGYGNSGVSQFGVGGAQVPGGIQPMAQVPNGIQPMGHISAIPALLPQQVGPSIGYGQGSGGMYHPPGMTMPMQSNQAMPIPIQSMPIPMQQMPIQQIPMQSHQQNMTMPMQMPMQSQNPPYMMMNAMGKNGIGPETLQPMPQAGGFIPNNGMQQQQGFPNVNVMIPRPPFAVPPGYTGYNNNTGMGMNPNPVNGVNPNVNNQGSMNNQNPNSKPNWQSFK